MNDYDLALSLEFMNAHSLDAARVVERIPINNTASLMTRTPPDIAANIIRMMDSLTIIRCFELMEPDAIGAIIEKLPLEIASMTLRKMDSVSRADKIIGDEKWTQRSKTLL